MVHDIAAMGIDGCFLFIDRPVALPNGGSALSIMLEKHTDDSATTAARRMKVQVSEGQKHGQYLVIYEPDEVGNFQISVLIEDEHIYGSPFALVVKPGPADAAHCHATGVGLLQAKEGEEASFEIQTFDARDHKLSTGGELFAVAIVMKGGGDTGSTTVSDRRDGTYSVSYTPKSAGEANLNILLRGKHIQHSPYTLEIEPADVHGPSCVALDLQQKLVANRAMTFAVEIKNRFSRPAVLNDSMESLAVLIGRHSVNTQYVVP